MIDLHCHSRCSDGDLLPAELIDFAHNQGVTMIALTDHDTIAGLGQARAQAKKYNMTFINGVELSVQWRKHCLHILGLNIQQTDSLKGLLDRQREQRELRAKRICDNLLKAGISDLYNESKNIANGAIITRPHIAKALVAKGIVKDIAMAFKRFLTRGKAGYVSTEWCLLSNALKEIKKASGVAVLAHPLRYKLTMTKLKELIEVFKDAGGDALEVISGLSTQSEIEKLAVLCKKYDLLASKGSDFHSQAYQRSVMGKLPLLPDNCVGVWQHFNFDY